MIYSIINIIINIGFYRWYYDKCYINSGIAIVNNNTYIVIGINEKLR